MLKCLTCAVAITLATFTPARAQTDLAADICNASLVADMLIGTYQAESSPQRMTLSGRTMMFGNWEIQTVEILHSNLMDYMLDLKSPDIAPIRMIEEDALEPDWYWSADPQLTGPNDPRKGSMSSADLEIVLGCQIGDLPRLTGKFTSLSQEGDTLSHTIRLLMYGDGQLFGSWHWTATPAQGPVDGVRSMHMWRTSGP